jgi:hypothetical protein
MKNRSCITVHMSRSSVSQPQRTQNNPLSLGTFSQTSLRYLKGTLGPQWKVVGRADTSQTSNGGIGGGTFNHWFVVTLAEPGWIILAKGPPRPNYIQISAYDLDKTPIQGNPIFQADSVEVNTNGDIYIPYLNTVMSAQSDLYNTFDRLRLDRGDDRYYPLNPGSYLICVSSTRNETLEYELGVVIEFPVDEAFFELEDFDGSVCLQETEIDAAEIVGPILSNLVISVNSFSETSCEIASGVTVTVNSGVTWYIGERIPAADYDNYKIILEVGDDAYYDTVHDHSLSEWQNAWEREHQDTDRFPELFVPLTNRP